MYFIPSIFVTQNTTNKIITNMFHKKINICEKINQITVSLVKIEGRKNPISPVTYKNINSENVSSI